MQIEYTICSVKTMLLLLFSFFQIRLQNFSSHPRKLSADQNVILQRLFYLSLIALVIEDPLILTENLAQHLRKALHLYMILLVIP